jgi:hypothetical protein
MLGKPGDEPSDHNEQPAQEDQGHGATHQLNQIHSGKQQALKIQNILEEAICFSKAGYISCQKHSIIVQ